MPNDSPDDAAALHGLDDRRVRVAEDHRPPRRHEVDVCDAVRVGRYGPVPLTMNRGVPPTARNARTGEFTPPGITRWARSNRAAETGASVTRASLASLSICA